MTRSAFENQYNRYSRYVYAILIARLPHGQAEDVLQEVFLEAWKRLGDLRDDASFGQWVAAIARNKTVDYFRRLKPLQPLEDVHARRSHEPDPILEALQKLPEAYRETLAMRFVEGLSGPEIAELTGHTHGSVRVNLSRGMALLRERLGVKTNA